MWWPGLTAKVIDMTKDTRITTLAARLDESVPTPTNTPVLITVAEVMLGTAATQLTPTRWRWLVAARKLLSAPLGARSAKRAHPSRRADYLEIAAMAREMHRL